MSESMYCGNGEKVPGSRRCTYVPCLGPTGAQAESGSSSCTDPKIQSQEIPNNGFDDNADGCVDEGSSRGAPPCSCITSCATYACPANVATCDARSRNAEICDGKDNNCNGRVDENCSPKKASCAEKAGDDPIILSNQAAVTEPFTDFASGTDSPLSITRTWSSMDGSFFGGTPGVFGSGWHHEWEGTLRCAGEYCTVVRGLEGGLQFERNGGYYRASAGPGIPVDHNSVLLRRSSGEWLLFLTDGTEMKFATVCDACDGGVGGDAYCTDPLSGGIARLTEVKDPRGNVIQVTYARSSGVLLGLTDVYGHTLEVRAASACGSSLASEVRYDDRTVARYSYEQTDLVLAADGEGLPLRSYVYDSAGTGLLHAVVNEAGAAITEFSYDADGRAIGVADRNSSVAVAYLADGLVEVSEYVGTTSHTSQRRLDVEGNVVSISDGCACGPARTLTWDRGNGNLACETDSAGRSRYRERDQRGRIIHDAEYSGACPPGKTLPTPARESWFDYGITKATEAGTTIELEHTLSRSRLSSVQTAGTAYAAESWDYDPAPNTIDPPGYTCQSAPLPVGAVVCREIASGYVPTSTGNVVERHATFYSYDARGRVTRKIGPINLDRASATDVPPVEERTYWSDGESLARRGRLREVRRYPGASALPLVTSLDYDAFGLSESTAPDGVVTRYQRDGRGRVRWVAGPNGRTEIRYYDGLDPRVTIAPSGAATRFTYDGKGRPVLVEQLPADPEVSGSTSVALWSEHTDYDPAGNAIHVDRRNASGAVVWQVDREYDVSHRVVRESHPEVPGASRSWSYDASGWLLSFSDEEARTTAFTPDALKRVHQVTKAGVDGTGVAASLAVGTYSYDPRSDVLSEVLDGRGQATGYKYDDFGRLYSVTTANQKSGPVVFAYDARGNLLSRQDASVTVSYTFDGLDRVLTESASNTVDGSAVAYTFHYDELGAAGKLTSVQEPGRVMRYGYDAAGRLATERIEVDGVATPLVTAYRYDANGALAAITYPSGLTVRYVRDPATREVVSVINETTGASFAAGVTHLPKGPVAALTFGNGLTLSHSFNRRLEPVAITTGPVMLGYTTGAAGDVTSISAGGTTRSFEYDFLDRLRASPGGFTYSWDDSGNLTGNGDRGFRYVGDRIVETKPFVYKGCYTDTATRALPVILMSTGTTAETCTAAARAKGLKYAGLQATQWCLGGDALGYTKVPEAECNMACTADPTQVCGGLWRNSVFEVIPERADSLLSFAYDRESNVSAVGTSRAQLYRGCYTDSVDRGLPAVLMSSGATVETCRAAARAQGFTYAGVQAAGWCFGGNELKHTRVSDSECNMPCSADPNVICGAGWRNSVYLAIDPPVACLRHDALGRLVLFGKTTPLAITPDGVACTSDADVSEVLARFQYDHRNRRIARWSAATGESTYVVSDAAGNPIAELASTGNAATPWRKVRDYVWLDGRPLAQVEYPGPAGSGEGYVYYFHVDHIGLPRALTNAAGQTVWSAAAQSFGDVVESTSTDPISGRTVVTNLRLPGQYDERLFAAAGFSGMQGPYYNWNRWYLPSAGRYLELDPLALRGLFNGEFGPDWYSYASGNPLIRSDPFGLTDRNTQCHNACKDMSGPMKEQCVKKCQEQLVKPACKKAPAECCEIDYWGCMQEIEPGSDGSEAKMEACQDARRKCHRECH